MGQGLIPLDFTWALEEINNPREYGSSDTTSGSAGALDTEIKGSNTSTTGGGLPSFATQAKRLQTKDGGPQATYQVNLSSGGVYKGMATFGVRISVVSHHLARQEGLEKDEPF